MEQRRGRVLLGQVLWNLRLLHFGPQELLKSPPWLARQREARMLPGFLVLGLPLPSLSLCVVQCVVHRTPHSGSETPYLRRERGRDESHRQTPVLTGTPEDTPTAHTS